MYGADKNIIFLATDSDAVIHDAMKYKNEFVFIIDFI